MYIYMILYRYEVMVVESLLYHLITENIDFNGTCEDQLRAMPGYTVAKARYDHACAQMNDLPDETSRKSFLEFESASNAMSSLLQDASLLVGFRMCLRLMTEVFRG